MEWNQCLFLFSGNPLPIRSSENFLVHFLIQDCFFPDWIDINQFDHPQSLVDWFLNWVASFRWPIYRKIFFFRIELEWVHYKSIISGNIWTVDLSIPACSTKSFAFAPTFCITSIEAISRTMKTFSCSLLNPLAIWKKADSLRGGNL